MLCLAFDLCPDWQYPVFIVFTDSTEKTSLFRNEIEALAEADETISIDIVDINPPSRERRWRERTL
jgi:hypothetical protein